MQFDQHSGWWLPDGEEHLQDWMRQVNDTRNGRLLYQGKKYRRALQFTKKRRVAVDVGAHVGLWSWQMAQDFDHVHAFEPILEHQDCWMKNMIWADFPNSATLHKVALGDHMGKVSLSRRTVNSSGDTGVDPDGLGVEVPLWKLDAFEIGTVDLVKIDCEGYELFVVHGGKDMLIEHKPCVIVEQKPETGGADRYGIGVTDAVKFLEGLGARVRAGIQGDYIMSWD